MLAGAQGALEAGEGAALAAQQALQLLLLAAEAGPAPPCCCVLQGLHPVSGALQGGGAHRGEPAAPTVQSQSRAFPLGPG